MFRRSNKGHVVPLPPSILSTLPNAHSHLRHLVLVPGHAIFSGCDSLHAYSDDNWILEKWQHDGTVKTLVQHITKGVEIAVQDPEALLVFSGFALLPS
jgi:hypothetical protein